MAAAMNGMALHSGVIPYGGTFLIFSDYCRPAIRLAALMGQRVIFVLTHDSIGLGEDGPTHQPVEHLAALRAIPNLVRVPAGRRGRDRRVLGAGAGARGRALGARADPPEPAGAAHRRPTTSTARARGAYVLDEAEGRRAVTLLATGSEVAIAARGAQTPAGLRHRLRGGLDALLGAVRAAGRDLPQGSAGRGPQDRGRGGGRRSAGPATCAARTTSSA